MRIAGTYSFNHGREVVEKHHGALLREIKRVIASIDEEAHKTKESQERTMSGQLLYSPTSLNKAFKAGFAAINGWVPVRVKSEYSVSYYERSYKPAAMNKGAFREMDFVKRGLGVEVQFGKYAFMVYNVCAKMTIFKNLGHIRAGVEIVPMKAFVQEDEQRSILLRAVRMGFRKTRRFKHRHPSSDTWNYCRLGKEAHANIA